jgi:prepilin-type N-terminal cleavage/methylation domain-containing protein
MAQPLLVYRSMKVHRTKSAGFTLVELGVVVAIIGILSVIAVVSYRKYMLHAKIAEGQDGISAIKIAQEDYRAERSVYADVGPTYCPKNAGVSDKKVGWNPDCEGGGSLKPETKWRQLPVHIAGAVQFQYKTVAGTGAYVHPTDAAWVTNPGAAPAGPWFVVMAQCDLDGQAGDMTQLFGGSVTNQIFVNNPGK